MHGNFEEGRANAYQTLERGKLRGLELGSRVAFGREFCAMTIRAFGHMHGQVVADMRGVILRMGKGQKTSCLVAWECIAEPQLCHTDHLVLADQVNREASGRYAPWIDY